MIQSMFVSVGIRAQKLIGESYAIKLVLRMLGLYLVFRLINWIMVGLVAPSGYYLPVLDHYLNYIDWLKTGILSTGRWLAGLLGTQAEMISHSTLLIGTSRLNMAAPCVGLEIMSFWAAFALADTTPWRTKLSWCLIGITCICLINSFRVMLLVIAMARRWPQVGTISHHDSFNTVSYVAIIGLMFVYYKHNGKAWS